MAENIFSSFNISGQGMSVQRLRLSAVARNIANANTTKADDGMPYKREVVVVRDIKDSPFEKSMNATLQLDKTNAGHSGSAMNNGMEGDDDVLRARTVKDNSAPRMVFDPNHPDANPDGYVQMPDINIVTEMVEMISAQRAFQANAQVVDAAKNLARYSLEI
ncbi:MAG: flagellar basal body rod protein FlgC [Ignavibacteriae bacterium HGW-Ignavibacteriae-4]|jgi:flagellar basal-body rod protein FlgC|nr:MAG: flagellar basal body rod protein FlgC [Ignavibacteriae bacterium HGW-Ignavibacteriae-4]